MARRWRAYCCVLLGSRTRIDSQTNTRLPYCQMGVCFECLVTVDGKRLDAGLSRSGGAGHENRKPARPREISEMKYDVVVIGAGPPGMSAAIRLRKNGSSVCGDRRATRTGRPDLARR